MKKVFLMIALTMGITASAVAQSEIKFGARAGLNFATLGGDNTDGIDSRVGFHIGGVADIPFTMFASGDVMQYLYLQPGLLISTKGYKYGEGDHAIKARPTYLEIPIMLSGAFPINDDIRVRANVGPYLAFGLLGKIKDDNNDAMDYFGDEGMKRFDFGLGFGAGVEWKQYYVGINYDLGLINTSNHTDDSKITNRAFMISLGYNF